MTPSDKLAEAVQRPPEVAADMCGPDTVSRFSGSCWGDARLISGKRSGTMRALCAYGDRLAGAALAQTLETSHRYLSQIMAPLVHRGWVTSTPGPSGGYELVAKVGSISVLELIEAMEGPTDTETGVLSGEACGTDDPCALHGVWSKAREDLLHQLDSISLADAWGAC